MKIRYKSISFAISLLIFASSCNSFLEDVDSRKDIDAGDAETVFMPESFLNATYGMFTSWDYGFSYLGITEILSDNGDKGSSSGDPGGDKLILDELTYTSSAGSIGAMWTNWYQTIGRAGQTIEYATNFVGADEAYKNRVIGEAKFLRAVCYFFLVRGWGDVTIQENGDLADRAPKADVYAHIEKDLLDAIAVLPAKYNDANIGRATKGAAEGLLAKVYLYQEKWLEAYDRAHAVITSTEYGYGLETNYENIWRETHENGIESLFEIQGRGDALAHGVQQYSATQGARGSTGWGWGFNTPSQGLLNAFNAENDNIRRDATIIFRNSTLYDGRVIGNTDNSMYNLKAYAGASSSTDDSDKNVRYLRLGEIYLIKAETANELGKTTEALEALNKIRNRVKLANITTTNKDDLRKAIWKERRLELAFEHDRWFDLVRTKQVKEAMTANGKKFVEGRHDLFPIPYTQMLQTPTMEQNPNW